MSFLLLGVARSPVLSGQAQPAPVVIRDVTIIDESGADPHTLYTVVITGRKIAAIGPAALIPIPQGSHEVDGSGKYLIPGLWDMHIHTASFALRRPVGRKPRMDENAPFVFPLLVANGVTGIRDMSGDLDVLARWRGEIAEGTRVGPRMVITGRKLGGEKPVVPGAPFPIRTPADVQGSVRMLREQGADFVKLDFVSPRLYPAVAAAAAAEGLTFVGHVHPRESVIDASNLGQRSVEHLQGLLEASTPAGVGIAGTGKLEPDSEPLGGSWTVGTAVFAMTVRTYYRAAKWWRHKRIHLHLLDVRAEEEDRLRQLLDSQSDSLAETAFAAFIRDDTWQVPTLGMLREMRGTITRDSIRQETRAYMPASLEERLRRSIRRDVGPALARERYARQLALVKAMARAGVPLLAGSDAMSSLRLPGFSLADELALLVEAGLTPKQALHAATVGPAVFLGKQDSLGTVETGKLADLVLLDANPLDDIQNVRRIQAVFLAGRYLPRKELNRMLEGVHNLVTNWREQPIEEH